MAEINYNYKQITKETFDQLIQQKKPVVLVFGAQWSGNSAIMDQVIKRVSKEISSSIHFIKVDIEKQKAISKLFRLQRVPTTLLIKDGEVANTVSGFLPVAKMKEMIKNIYT